jgi:phosphomevalonate kinase
MTETAIAHPVQAPGKMMWLGEYAVLDGAPAIVAAIDRYVRVGFEPGGEGLRLASNLWEGEWTAQAADGTLLPEQPSEAQRLAYAVVRTVADALTDVRWQAGVLHIDSSELSRDSKLGLGSSGAVAAALTVALAGRAIPVDARLLELALHAHHTFQGRAGSGSDVTASMLGGVVHCGGGRPPFRVTGALPAFVAFYAGQSADTRDMVRRMRQWQHSDGQQAIKLLTRLRDIAGRGAFALRKSDRPGFIDAVERFARAERDLTLASGVPIVSDSIGAIMDFCFQNGYIAKPSGAGGGDVVVGFHLQPNVAYQADAEVHARGWLRDAARERNLDLLDLKIAFEGALSVLTVDEG